MNPEQNASGELSFEESVKQVMQTLPLPIRHYLGQLKHSAVAKRLMQKYGLHLDQGGMLENELMLLLMGIETPDEFEVALKMKGGIPQDTVYAIMSDVNQEVFIPLRSEMQNPAPQQAPKPPMPARPAPPNVATGTPDYTGRMKIQMPPLPVPPQSQRVIMPVAPATPTLQRQMPSAPIENVSRAPIMNPQRELPRGEGMTAPLPPKATLPRPTLAPRPAPVTPPQPARPAQVIPPVPQPSVFPASRPSALPSEPPANLPGAFVPAPRAPYMPPPALPQQDYDAIDPYREPVE